MRAHDRNLEECFAEVGRGVSCCRGSSGTRAWGPGKVADLLQTVIDGLPAGASLILGVGDKPQFISLPMETAPPTAHHVVHLPEDDLEQFAEAPPGRVLRRSRWSASTGMSEAGTCGLRGQTTPCCARAEQSDRQQASFEQE